MSWSSQKVAASALSSVLHNQMNNLFCQVYTTLDPNSKSDLRDPKKFYALRLGDILLSAV